MHRCSCTVYKVFIFSERVIGVWNGLSPDSVDFSYLVKFKCSINSISFSEYLEFK